MRTTRSNVYGSRAFVSVAVISVGWLIASGTFSLSMGMVSGKDTD